MFSHVQPDLGTTDFKDRTHRSQRLITIGNEEKGKINDISILGSWETMNK